ncbi:hypothetical protein [Polyangium fumosum]|uniref:DUF2946 domain-containing protein n=1 Tax=Polyangium fumosum TaxID=889272 RepID=A0A4U1JGR6_9BACT|nr:hypothetical protein [Polyangium fumosum]TKD10331.1 hypothetical protein E8A74_07720 [Polyangium fumosum]
MRILLVAVRLFVALTAFQMTGLPHFAVDAVAAIQDGDTPVHRDDDCPNEKDGRECPPGCPDCHCAHLMGALPPLVSPYLLELPSGADLMLAPYEATAPPRPDPSAIYRPPRPIRA